VGGLASSTAAAFRFVSAAPLSPATAANATDNTKTNLRKVQP
jgi:hypothetical protein